MSSNMISNPLAQQVTLTKGCSCCQGMQIFQYYLLPIATNVRRPLAELLFHNTQVSGSRNCPSQQGMLDNSPGQHH